MTSDSQIAQLLVDLYSWPMPHGVVSGTTLINGVGFDYYKPGADAIGICYGLQILPDENIVCLRGSKSLVDWARDLFAIPAVFPHEVYGPVHAGFAIGLDRIAYEISTKIDFAKPTTIAGHSLGGARARILTAIFLENYQRDPKMLKTICFGEPLSGFQQLADYLAPVESRSYRNGVGEHHDMVTDAPVRIPPLLNWVRASPLIYVSQSGAGSLLEQAVDPFYFHHAPLYAAALAKLEGN